MTLPFWMRVLLVLLGWAMNSIAARAAENSPEEMMFGGNSVASRLLLDQMGQAVVQLLHPLCAHGSTVARRESAAWVFTTRYSFLKREHTLVWRVVFDGRALADVGFVSDTNPVPTAKLAARAREKLAPHLRAYLEKR